MFHALLWAYGDKKSYETITLGESRIMIKLLIIGVGGFIGAILRYSLSGAIQSASKSVSFPYGKRHVSVRRLTS